MSLDRGEVFKIPQGTEEKPVKKRPHRQLCKRPIKEVEE